MNYLRNEKYKRRIQYLYIKIKTYTQNTKKNQIYTHYKDQNIVCTDHQTPDDDIDIPTILFSTI